MIKPLYFPNIYVNEEISEALKTQLGTICVYGAAADFLHSEPQNKDEGNYERILPDYGDETRFNEFLLTCSDTKPLYEPNRAFQITAELQKRVDDVTPCKDSGDSEEERLMRARLFLQMAHEYDIQSKVISQELSACKKREQELLNKLHGFDNDGDLRADMSVGESEGYSSDYRVEKRFESWAVIFEKALTEQGKSGSGFFLTDFSVLIENIVEFEPEVEFVCDVSLGLIEEGSLSNFVEKLIMCDWNLEKENFKSTDTKVNESDKPFISLYILPEKQPFELFKKFITGKSADENTKRRVNSCRNTVLGYIEI